MIDWKKRIEDKRNAELQRAEAERQRKLARERAEVEAAQRRQQQKIEADYARRVAKLGSRFKCHICSRPALRPGHREERTSIPVTHHEFYSGPVEYEITTVTDWNIPDDLTKCSRCHKWTCAEHIHWDICKNCAEIL